jgi:predicted ATPase
MIPVLERERLHFRIGTWIRQDIDDTVGEEKSAKSPESLNRLSLKFIDSILLIAVDQLNRGAEHVRDTSERIAIANLNLTAADTAIGKLTFIAASDFLRAGLKLLGQDKWDSHYGLTRDLTTRLAHSELCLGNFDASEMAADDVIQHTQNSSKGDSVKAYITKIQCLSGNGKLCEAIDLGFFVLELLGECFNRHWKVWNALSDMSISQLILLGKSDDDLMSLPLMEDEDKVAAMRVLGFVLSYAYLMQDTTSLLLSAFRMMKLSLTCGKSHSTPFGIACYGVFTSTTENFEKAYRYGNLALRMQEQLQAKEFSLLTVVLVYSFANHWKHPLSDGLVPLLNSYKLATETGTAETAFNCIARYAAMAFQCGSVPLWAVEEELRSLTHKFVKFDGDCEENEPTPFWQAQLVPYLQATLNLMGQSEHTVELTGEVMDQGQLTREAMESGNKMATTVILFNRYFLATIFEEYEAAEECISELETSVGNSKSKLHYAYWGLRFYRGLNSYGMFRTTGNENYLREARRMTKELSTMSDLGYTNCTPMCLLLAAEECASSGNTNDARETYDRAICSAAGAGCIHFEGIANEKCGAMFLKEGQLKTAEMYLRRALALMSEWGANAKVEQIEEKYRLLLFGAPVEVTLPLVPTKRSASSGRQE